MNTETKKRLAVIGSRSFNNYERLKQILLKNIDKIEHIVSGGARGSDELGRRFCQEFGLACMIFYPKWKKDNGEHDPGAGFRRNHLIIKNCDHVLAFWDKKSSGTKNSLDIAQKLGKPVTIIYFTPDPPQPQPANEAPPNPAQNSENSAPKKRGRPKKVKEPALEEVVDGVVKVIAGVEKSGPIAPHPELETTVVKNSPEYSENDNVDL